MPDRRENVKNQHCVRYRKYRPDQLPMGKQFKEWTILETLDDTRHSWFYVVQNGETGKQAVLKATLRIHRREMGQEVKIMRKLAEHDTQPHIPKCYHAAHHGGFVYMITTRFGIRLSDPKLRQNTPNFSVSTWIRVGIQCLYALKILHNAGYVHRNLRPECLWMGHSGDANRARYGTSRDRWIARLPRKAWYFDSDVAYSSPNAHEGFELGRRDDIWSLMYMLIDFHCGLPWKGDELERKNSGIKKWYMKDEHLMQNMPHELRDIIPELHKLDYYQRPDYLGIYNRFVAAQKRYGIGNEDPYDWELVTDGSKSKSKSKSGRPPIPPAWWDAADFFKYDPLRIKSAPDEEDRAWQPKKKAQSTTERDELKRETGDTDD